MSLWILGLVLLDLLAAKNGANRLLWWVIITNKQLALAIIIAINKWNVTINIYRRRRGDCHNLGGVAVVGETIAGRSASSPVMISLLVMGSTIRKELDLSLHDPPRLIKRGCAFVGVVTGTCWDLVLVMGEVGPRCPVTNGRRRGACPASVPPTHGPPWLFSVKYLKVPKMSDNSKETN